MTSKMLIRFVNLLLISGFCITFVFVAGISAQSQTQPAAPPATPPPGAADRAAIAADSAAERERERKLLGIKEMRPGVTAYDIGAQGNANYDETRANPYPNLPPLLT